MQSVDNWQAAWNNSSKGRWTHQLISSIESWVNRKHGQVDFYLTQALSGTIASEASLSASDTTRRTVAQSAAVGLLRTLSTSSLNVAALATTAKH